MRPLLRPNDGHGIRCGCDGRARAHDSCCGNVFGNDVANGICTSGEAVCFGHHVQYGRRTSQPGCGFRSISFHLTIALHPQRHVCLRIRQMRNLVGCGLPKRFSEGHTSRKRFQSHVSMRRILGSRRKLCTASPIRGIVPYCSYQRGCSADVK